MMEPNTRPIRVLLTGAGGTMGGAALRELTGPERRGRYELTILDLPTPANRRKLARYARRGVRVLWGDLTRYEDVLPAVTGADVVLHPAAFISPAADRDPARAWRVNVGAAANLVRAIRAQPDPDAVRLVNVGSVAMTGDRLPPIHVGRAGDPLMPSIFDIYACSKIAAERIVAESGLRRWVSLRQTYIPQTRTAPDPILYHQPLNTCLEICTERMAGLLLANACDPDLPDDFWRRFYNIGGGPAARIGYWAFIEQVLAAGGISRPEAVFDRNWFALRNFHCHWFEDSDALDAYLHYQVEGVDDYLSALGAATPWYERLAAQLAPPRTIRRRVFEPLARTRPDSPLYWLEHGEKRRFTAFYGSRQAFAAIPDWDDAPLEAPGPADYRRLDHGYDESRPIESLELEDMREAAAFRGGVCLSAEMEPGELYAPLRWRCAFGHSFEATPNLVLRGGHWCPTCAPPPWNYAAQARRSPFLAQVWYANHAWEETGVYYADVELPAIG